MRTPNVSELLNAGDWSSPVPHDYRELTYVAAGAANDDDLETIVYKRGGASGTAVATLTMTYVGATNNIATQTLTLL